MRKIVLTADQIGSIADSLSLFSDSFTPVHFVSQGSVVCVADAKQLDGKHEQPRWQLFSIWNGRREYNICDVNFMAIGAECGKRQF